MDILIFIALCFGAIFCLDKLFQGVFRSKRLHKSGQAVRLPKRYATIGLILVFVGVLAVVVGATESTVLLAGGILVGLVGIGLIVYYLSFGIYYDTDDFMLETFGKKSVTYAYRDIIHQQLYAMQGGATVIELHMKDGTSVQVSSQMPEYDKFLNHAFAQWCRQRGIDPASCDFHDPEKSLWFKNLEV